MLAYEVSCLQLWPGWIFVFNKEMSGEPSLTFLGFAEGLGPGVPLAAVLAVGRTLDL